MKISIVLAICLNLVLGCTNADKGRENVAAYVQTYAPQSITYNSSDLVLLQGTNITPLIPTIAAKLQITYCSISPALPAGLNFDTTNCSISGAPVGLQNATAYIVTATNDVGSKSETITIAVTASVIPSCPINSTDAAPSTTKCTAGTSYTNETGTDTTLTFLLHLSAQPTSNVALTVASSDTTEARLATTAGDCDSSSSASQPSCIITFTTANWNIDQSVKVIAFNDFISHESPAPIYNITVGGSPVFQNIISNQEPNRLTFVTTNTSTGNLGGVAGADALCMSDPGHPDAALPLASRRSFKAFITTTGGAIRQWDSPAGRGSPGRIDWIMEANAVYYRVDQTTIITTTNATQNFSSMNNSVDGTANESWLGFLPGNTWTAYIMGCGAPCPMNTGSCLNFTDGTNTQNLRTLIQNTTAVSNLSSTSTVRYCDALRHLWCIQQ